MKEYVTLDTHWKDLKLTKQKVNQIAMTMINDTSDPSIDDISAVIIYISYIIDYYTHIINIILIVIEKLIFIRYRN